MPKSIRTLVNKFIFYVKLLIFLKVDKTREVIDWVNFSFKYFNKPIRFWQIKEEITALIEFLKVREPKLIMEIGTAGGGSLYLLTKVACSPSKVISLDLPHGKFGGGYPAHRKLLYKYMTKKKQKIYLIQGDSHSLASFSKVKKILNGEKLDFIFIDGDHSYEGVKRDFELYSQLLSKVGCIAFHDIVDGPIDNVGGVPAFWKEIKENYKVVEFVKDWKQGGFGIGVLIDGINQ